MKDSIIIILIIVIVIIGNIISQNILKKDSEEIIANLEKLKQKIEKQENLKETAEEIYNQWEETDEKWSIIVTHQELDQIKKAITSVKSGIESNDLSFAYQQIENSIFLVSHIKEKEALAWKNIF